MLVVTGRYVVAVLFKSIDLVTLLDLLINICTGTSKLIYVHQ